MKVLSLTAAQQTELKALQTTLTEAQDVARTAHQALQKAMTTVIGSKVTGLHIQLSEDGTTLIF
jgi:hypothetical protein